MQIYIQRGTEKLGTFTLEETTQQLSEGHLLETDLAWLEGLEEWQRLGQLHQELLSDAETLVPEGGQGDSQPDIPASERYRKEKLLGEGGMGQVWSLNFSRNSFESTTAERLRRAATVSGAGWARAASRVPNDSSINSHPDKRKAL